MLRISPDPQGLHISGPTQLDELEYTLYLLDVELPERDLPDVLLPSVRVQPYTKAGTQTHELVKLHDHTGYQVVEPSDPGHFAAVLLDEIAGELVDEETMASAPATLRGVWSLRQIRKFTGDNDSQTVTSFHLRNRYSKKTWTGFPVYRVRPSLLRTPGVYDPGSLGAACLSMVEQVFAGVTPGSESQDLYLNGGTYANSGAGPVASRNPSRVLPAMDFSGVSASRAAVGGSPSQPASLITRRHALCAHHTQIHIGTDVWFMRSDGSMQKVTVIDRFDETNEDLTILMFDQDVTGCEIYKTLPLNWYEYLPGSAGEALQGYTAVGAVSAALPVVVRQANTGVFPEGTRLPENRNNPIDTLSPKIRVEWVWAIGSATSATPQVMCCYIFQGIPGHPLQAYWQAAYGGDSGSPMFLLVPDGSPAGFTPALISCYYFPTAGAPIANMSARINLAMNNMAVANGVPGTFTFGTVDLSAYPKYPLGF